MTLKIVIHPNVAQWMLDRMPDEDIRDVSQIGQYVPFGVFKEMPNGKTVPLAGVVFNDFRKLEHGNDIRVIVVAEDPRWCLPGILREIFRYPFETAGCARITAVIKEGNKRSLKLCQGLGFRKEGVIRRGYNGKSNAIVLGMLKSECKWLNRKPGMKNGQIYTFHAAGAGPRQDRPSANC